ncbi:hypothetical protein B0H21DRAFT_755288 [Amylocystis lapponica]|nr:hypothetical protein B0H21DRAFT_755288 [Amylocystis lapponica]
MSLHDAHFELSDEDGLSTPADVHTSADRRVRRRSTRACDQCRRTKSKCERNVYGPPKQPCYGCLSLGLHCTFAGPSHKRGPPKGYILAIERRLHQVEALLGTIIASDDPRALGLLEDLSHDRLASQIIQRVDAGPFGPRGRGVHPFGSTKEAFLASIMSGVNEEASSGSDAATALIIPSTNWQDGLHRLLSKSSAAIVHAHGTSGPVQGFVDASSRRASYPMMSSEAQLPFRGASVSPAMTMSSMASSLGDSPEQAGIGGFELPRFDGAYLRVHVMSSLYITTSRPR